MRLDDQQDDFNDEIEAHLQMAIEDRVWRGEPEQAARASALREFGNPALIRDVSAQLRGVVWADRITRDIRFAFRQIRKNPTFSLVLLVMLALGTAALALIATVSLRILLRDLPYGNADGIYEIRLANPQSELSGLHYSAIAASNHKAQALSQIAYSTDDRRVFFLQARGQVIKVSAPRVSQNLFRLLDVRPLMGNSFEASKTRNEEGRFLILSNRLWRDEFQSNADIIGETVVLSGIPYIVSAVMPSNFHFPIDSEQPQLWICTCGKDRDLSPSMQPNRRFRMFARLHENVRTEVAVSRLNHDLATLDLPQFQWIQSDLRVRMDTYKSTIVDASTRKGLIALLLGAILLWLIACINATSLLFARSFARQKEFTIRRAVGGSSWRILRQLFIETLVISCLAALIGYGISVVAISLSRDTLQVFTHVEVSMMPNVYIFAALVAIAFASAIICCAPSSANILRATTQRSLLPGRTRNPRVLRRYRRRFLIIVEVAMTFTLLVACSLLVRTINRMRDASAALRSEHVLVSDLKIPAYKFPHDNTYTKLLTPLVHRLEHLKGVEAVTVLTNVPFDDAYKISFSMGDSVAGSSPGRANLRADLRAVSPDMERVFNIRMLRGRFFNTSDTSNAPFVVVVNRAFADAYAVYGKSPMDIVGHTIFDDGPNRHARVIGVRDDTPQDSLTRPVEPEIDVCILQIAPNSRLYEAVQRLAVSVAVKTKAAPSVMIPILKSQIEAQDPQFAPVNVFSMNDVVASSFAGRQIGAELTSIFGIVALLLSMGGIYGLLTYLVAERTKEFGIRIAVGASALRIAFMVAREAIWMVLIGSGLGICMVYSCGHFIDPFLFGIKSNNFATIALVFALIMGSGVAASFFPAYRAAYTDASRALRAS